MWTDYHKTDKDGRPVYIEQLGKIDITKIQQITSDERMLQNLVVEYEKMVGSLFCGQIVARYNRC